MADPRKLQSRMLVLAALGGLLFMPPLVYVFNQTIRYFGVPQIVIYLFVVWTLLIVGTALLTRQLPRSAVAVEPGEVEKP